MTLRLIYILCVGLLLQAPAAAAEAGNAEVFLKKKHDAVTKVLKKPNSPTRKEKLTVLLEDLLDYEEVAKRSLATQWEKRKKAERDEFVSLLKQLVERSYQKSLEGTISYRVRYVGTENLELGTLVKTSAKSQKQKRTPAVTIDYSMRPEGERWRVYDIVTDGVSMVKNYRRQFRRIIRDEGWDGLIGRMQKKLDAPDDTF